MNETQQPGDPTSPAVEPTDAPVDANAVPGDGQVIVAAPQEPANVVTAGELLRSAREASGLHIAALAVSLKVPVKKLEALEADRLDELLDAVFVRALAASVARSLKMDPVPVLALLPGSGVPRLTHDQQGINTPFRSPSDGPGPGVREHLTRPVMLMVLALLLGAVVLLFLPDFKALQTQSQTRDDTVAVPLAQRAEVASKPDVAASAVLAILPSLSDSQPLAQLPPPTASKPTTEVASQRPLPVLTASAQTAVAPVSVVASAPVLAAPPATGLGTAVAGMADGGLVSFRASGTSWVEVTDGKGVVVLRKTLSAGESAGAQGAMPLAVVVGRADATQVRVRGKAFDLAPVAKDNVARFEVK